MPEDAQDFGSQDASGGGTGTGGIFDSYLQAVPDDAREAVTGYLKDAERHVNERIQSASELEKQFGPYSGLELPEPQELSELLEWRNNTLTSQDAFDAWVTQVAEEKGLTKAEVEQAYDEGEQAGLSEQRIQELLDQRLEQDPRAMELEERLAEMETTQAVELETDSINRSLGALEQEAGVKLNEQQREAVLKLGMAHAYDDRGNELPAGDTSWVPKGFQDYKDIGAEANRTFLEDASRQPAGAMPTGGSAKQAPVTTFEDAASALRERIRANRT